MNIWFQFRPRRALPRAARSTTILPVAVLLGCAQPSHPIESTDRWAGPERSVSQGSPATQPGRAAAATRDPRAAAASIPLGFERNDGQFPAEVQYVARTAHGSVFLTREGMVLTVPAAHCAPTAPSSAASNAATSCELRAVRVTFADARAPAAIIPQGAQPGASHYYRGDDRSAWRENVPSFDRVRYTSVYDGIDVVFRGNQRQVEYDFVVAPRADPSGVGVRIEGADRVETAADGSLALHVGEQVISFGAPVTMQELPSPVVVPSRYRLDSSGTRASIEVAAYDRSRELVIDPLIRLATFVGGSARDSAWGLAFDAAGNIYIAGSTASADYPTTAGAHQSMLGGVAGDRDCFITKLNSTATARLFSTFIGGSSNELCSDITVDAVGNAYVTGSSSSTNYPVTTGALRPATAGNGEALVSKFTTTGTLSFSALLGGSGADSGSRIAVSAGGSVFIVGETVSDDFPVTVGAFQRGRAGSFDMFVSRLNAAGTVLVYSTFLGGSRVDTPLGIVVDSLGRATILGQTSSMNYPTEGPGDPSFNGGTNDAVVSTLSAAGATLINSRYLGGSGADFGATLSSASLAIDALDNIYLTGATESRDFPMVDAADSTFAGANNDVYLVKMAPASASVIFSTYVAAGAMTGMGRRLSPSVSVSPTGDVFATWVQGSGGIETALTYGSCGFGRESATARFSSTGARLGVAVYDGVLVSDTAVNASGQLFVFGASSNISLATPGVVQPTRGGLDDAFLAQVILDVPSGSRSCGPCTGDAGSLGTNPCPVGTPRCIRSGANAGACTLAMAGCNGDFGSGAAGACESAAAPACVGTMCRQCSAVNLSACTGAAASCDPAANTCSRCTSNHGAATGAACPTAALAICVTPGSATGACVQCTSDANCTGATPACNTATRACVAAAVALTNPPAGGRATSANLMPAITGTGVPGQMVTVTRDGAAACAATVAANGQWSCTPSAFAPGTFTIVATAQGATSTGTLVVQCTLDAQCGGASRRCLVASGVCVQCLASADCSGATPVCNGATNVCGATNDRDGDALPDALEVTLGTNPDDPDSDGDGVRDNVEVGANAAVPRNSDMDARIDALDADDDDDTVLTANELGADGGAAPRNTDGADAVDYLDPDDDNDTIATAVEVTSDTSADADRDRDGIPSYLDADSDGDTVPDQTEVGASPAMPANTDASDTVDFLDTDSDNDCLLDSDAREAGAARTNAAMPNASANDNCAGATPVCETSSGACVLCVLTGPVASQGCATEANGLRCLEPAGSPRACGCINNEDCAAGSQCDTGASRCVVTAVDAGVDGGRDAMEASVVADATIAEAAADGAALDTRSDASSRPPTGSGACSCQAAGAAGSAHTKLLWLVPLGVASLRKRRSRRRA